jgi:hypothetical protein
MQHSIFCTAPLLLVVACQAAPKPAPKLPTKAEPVVTEVDPLLIKAFDRKDLMREFEQARSYLLVDQFERAAKAFARLRDIATDRDLKALAIFNVGLAHEGLLNRQVALEHFSQVAKDYADLAISKSALIRGIRLQGYLERWDKLLAFSEQLIKRKDLSPLNRIEALGAKALGHIEQGDVTRAEAAILRAQSAIEKAGLGQTIKPPFQFAQVFFASGEALRLKSEKITLTRGDGKQEPLRVVDDFSAVLEKRCQALLDAQAAYTEAMRARDGHWSAMSGYRLGQLYHQLYEETLKLPAPPSAKTTQQQELFAAAMRLRYRVLLEKGLRMMAATVRLGQRTGNVSYWIARAHRAKQELEASLKREKEALAKLPFSEKELKQALARLRARARKRPAPKP